jgi:ethanolamine utilization protein EutA (predicted chaperonin)
MNLTNSDLKNLRLYIIKRYGRNYYRLEPDDILNETIVYLIEKNKFKSSNIRYIASSTFYAISNLKKRYVVSEKLKKNNLLKIEETLKEEQIQTPYNNLYEKELQKLILNYKPKSSGKSRVGIICLTTGEKFDSISDAANKYKLSVSNIGRNLRKEIPFVGKLNGQKLVWEKLNKG